jgi:hypothetical protein
MKLKENTERVVSDLIDGEMMLLNMEAGTYYSLVGTGAALWTSLQVGAEDSVLLQALERAFPDIDASRLQDELRDFLKTLKEEDLVVSCEICSDDSPSFGDAYETPKIQKYSDLQDLLLIDPIHEAGDSGWPTVAN